MGRAWAGLVRNALGSMAIAGIVGAVAFGLPAFDRSIPAGLPVSSHAAYNVGGGVSVIPPMGASLDATRTRPGDDRGTALFVIGGVRLLLVVGPFRGTLDEAADRIRNKITTTAGLQVTSADQHVDTADGVDGRRGSYTSAGRLGEYAVFVVADLAVEVTVSGPEHQLRDLAPRLEESLRSIEFPGDP